MLPGHRGGGHGTALLRALARICVERGYARLEWWVLDWNAAAIGFYRSIGAESMDEWTVNRVSGEPLRRLAAAAARAAPGAATGVATGEEDAPIASESGRFDAPGDGVVSKGDGWST